LPSLPPPPTARPPARPPASRARPRALPRQAQLVLLSALARANDAITELLAAEAAGDVNAPATQPALAALEAEMASLVRTFEDKSAFCSGPGGSAPAAPGGAGPGGAAAAAPRWLSPPRCGGPGESGPAFSGCSAIGSVAHSSTRPAGGGAPAAGGGGAGIGELNPARLGLISTPGITRFLRE
jgi:hypothetical protein